MKTYPSMHILLLWFVLSAPACAVGTDPIAKVLQMVSRLQQEVIKEGSQEQKVYNKFSQMCSDESRTYHQEIKTAKGNSQGLSAAIEKATADVTVLQEKIAEMADKSADAEAELKKATSLRKKESNDFQAAEKELLKTVSSIERAIAVIEREGPGASLAQVENMQSVTQVLQAMVEASTVDSYDAATLTALVQSSSERSAASEDAEEDSEEDDTGAPSAASYKGKSTVIVDQLNGLLEKSQKQLDEERQEETRAMNAYAMLKQSLEDKIGTLTNEMGKAKKNLAATEESKATAQGDLESTNKDLAEDMTELEKLHHDCLERATTFEDAAASRSEELKALAEAKKIVAESTGAAVKQTYSLAQMTFLQVSSKEKSASTAAGALHIVRRMALTLHSNGLMDLSTHMAKAIRNSAQIGADPFGKVRGMINSMISKLEAAAEADATKKSYCDKEMSETKASKENKDDSVEQLSIKIDAMTSSSRQLKEQVSRLEKELAWLARTQVELDKLRAEEKTAYGKNKPAMEQGLEGVKNALRVLRDYYAKDDKSHDAADGAGSGIIGMLEVVEADFSKGIAEMTAGEDSEQSEYEAVSKENKVARAAKEQSAKYKTKEYVALDKSVAESRADRSGVQEELNAVVEYFASVQKECIAMPDSYEERKKRREAEISGLREALETLQGGSVLLQQSKVRKTLRGNLEASA